MKLARVLTILFVAAILASLLGWFVYSFTKEKALPEGTQKIDYQFSVAAEFGVDVKSDILRLGTLQPASQAHRSLIIQDSLAALASNDSNAPKHQVRIVAIGAGSQWISANPVVVTVPGDSIIQVSVPQNAAFGTYRGTLLVIPISEK